MSDYLPQGERVFAGPLALVRLLSLDEVTDAARRKALDPEIFDGRQPFVWRAEASSTRIDAYFTHMSVRTLRNFAQDAETGVSFQNSHRTFEMPIGRSIAGQFVDAVGKSGVARMLADFFTLPGLNLNGLNTDDFIAAVRAGITKDVSVGFSGGKLLCDIDGEDYLRGECRHILGLDYPTEGAKKGQRIVATGEWDDSRLREVSSVYEGATPGAEIIAVKAQQEADAGRLAPETARFLESQYQIRIKGADRQWGGSPLSIPDDTTIASTSNYTLTFTDGRSVPIELAADTEMTQHQIPASVTPAEEERTMPPEANGAPELTVEQRAHLQLGVDLSALVAGRSLLHEGETPIAAVTRLADDNARLRPLADMGTRYRTDLIAEALAEGVRAEGEAFPAETRRGMLERSSIDEITSMRDSWKTAGDTRLPGGRVTVEGDETERQPVTAGRRGVPNTAYGG